MDRTVSGSSKSVLGESEANAAGAGAGLAGGCSDALRFRPCRISQEIPMAHKSMRPRKQTAFQAKRGGRGIGVSIQNIQHSVATARHGRLHSLGGAAILSKYRCMTVSPKG
jgi:hypothetical protein